MENEAEIPVIADVIAQVQKQLGCGGDENVIYPYYVAHARRVVSQLRWRGTRPIKGLLISDMYRYSDARGNSMTVCS